MPVTTEKAATAAGGYSSQTVVGRLNICKIPCLPKNVSTGHQHLIWLIVTCLGGEKLGYLLEVALHVLQRVGVEMPPLCRDALKPAASHDFAQQLPVFDLLPIQSTTL